MLNRCTKCDRISRGWNLSSLNNRWICRKCYSRMFPEQPEPDHGRSRLLEVLEDGDRYSPEKWCEVAGVPLEALTVHNIDLLNMLRQPIDRSIPPRKRLEKAIESMQKRGCKITLAKLRAEARVSAWELHRNPDLLDRFPRRRCAKPNRPALARQRLVEALDVIQEEGRPFLIKDLIEIAGVEESTLRYHTDLHGRAKELKRRFKNKCNGSL